MEHSNFKSELFKLTFNSETIIDTIASFQEEFLEEQGYKTDIEKSSRGETLFAIPIDIEKPFVSIHTTFTDNGSRKEIKLGWSMLDENGNIPTQVSSQSAKRKNGLPAIISAVIENGRILIKEVLFSDDIGFERFLFDDSGSVEAKWFLKKNNINAKIYELNRPLYVSFHANGSPKEVWFSNPDAQSFVDTSCTYRMTDDHPVVISFYDDGNIHMVDYTGVTFAKETSNSVLNFPFNSRFQYYLPSFYLYSPVNEFGRQTLVLSKYFFGKEEQHEEDVKGMIESYGIDTSDTEHVKALLEANPVFDRGIRSMFGISVITDAQLDETIMLHETQK